MDSGAIYAFITAIGFKTNTLTVRRLQENGVAATDTYTIYRYALVPAVIWSFIFVRGADLHRIFNSPKLLLIFGAIVIFWNMQAYLRALIATSTNSVVLFSTIFNILVFPLFLGVGVFFNHDKLNVFSASSVVVLLAALLIKPTPHHQNKRPRLAKPLPVLIPLTWFLASIPESFSLAAIPIYVFLAINVVTFLMDVVSDLIHKRLHLTLQTVGFIVVVLAGISLSVLSLGS